MIHCKTTSQVGLDESLTQGEHSVFVIPGSKQPVLTKTHTGNMLSRNPATTRTHLDAYQGGSNANVTHNNNAMRTHNGCIANTDEVLEVRSVTTVDDGMD